MRLLILLVVVGVCLVSAKYLPDESNNFKQLLSRHKRSDSEDSFDGSSSNDTDDVSDEEVWEQSKMHARTDSLDGSSSNDTDDISDEELREQSKLHARIEKMRQKLMEKQEKERRRQEEAQKKLEEKITKELQKEEERRQKEEERRQKELEKEEERRQKELQKEEARRQKEEEKRQKELLKHEEKLEKERIKLEERQKKLREKTFENEQKRQEMLQKQLQEMEEETLKLQEGDSNSSNSDTDESSELEDFWKSYIYAKYGLNESNTELEKRIALRRYMQEELGLNVNSTESERRQAILSLIESKWQAVSEQYVLQSQMIDFVNRVGVEKIRAQIEKEIEEINNKTDILNNINLPWVQLARDNFAEQASFLQTIKEFLASILPNWYNESIPSTESTFNEASSQNEIVTYLPSENQKVFESPVVTSDVSNKGDNLPNINNSNAINTPITPILSENSESSVAVDSSSTILDKNPSPTIGSSANEGSSTKGAGNTGSSIITDVDTNKPTVLSTVKSVIVSTTVSRTAPGSDFADVASNSKNEVDSNGSSADGKNLVVGPNSISKPISTNLISNKDDLPSVISKDASSPSDTSNVNNSDIVSTTVTGRAPGGVSDSVPIVSNSKTDVDSTAFSTDGMNLATGTNSNSNIPAISESTSSNLNNNHNALPSLISTDALLPSSTSVTSEASLNNEQDSSIPVNGNVVPIANQDSISNSVSTTSDTIISVAGRTTTDDILTSEIVKNVADDIKRDTILPSSENASIKTNVNDNLPSTVGSDDSSYRPADKINSPSIDQDASVTKIPTNDLSILVTNIMSSLFTTEASEVVPKVASDLESKLNSDILQSTVNNSKVANNNLTHVSNVPSPNNFANNDNILPSATERSELNIIKSVARETGIENNMEDVLSTASSFATSTDATIYSSSSSSNDNNPTITLSPALLTESQDSASSITNDSTNTGKSDITADHITTVITESSNNIIAPNAEPVQPTVDVATNNKNEENISSISTSPSDNVIESHTDKIFSSNITPNDATANNEQTISILITTTESAKPIVNESTDNQHLEGVDVASKVDDQNNSKTLDVTDNKNSSEPLSTTSSIDLDNVASTVSDATYEKDALVISTLSPSTIVTDNVASKGANVSNSDIIISKNTSTNSNAVSNAETIELPTSVTDLKTKVLDQSTSVVSDAQQVGNDNVTENQFTETDITLSDAGISTVTESGNNDSIKDQENPIDNITVPVEPGASIIAVAQQ